MRLHFVLLHVALLLASIFGQTASAEPHFNRMPPVRDQVVYANEGVRSADTSPFTPPTDNVFIANKGSGLDTGCSTGVLTIDIVVDTAVGEVDANGFLVDAESLIKNGVIPETVQLVLPAWDVDIYGDPDPKNDIPPEVDRLFFNGQLAGTLTGNNAIWRLNTFNINVRRIKFPVPPPMPADPVTPVANQVQIFVDILGGEWCTAVDWVALVVPIETTYAFSLKVTDGIGVREIPDGVVYEQSFDADCNVIDDISAPEEFPIAGIRRRDAVVEVSVAKCPSGGSPPVVELHWVLNGIGVQQVRGEKTWKSTAEEVDIRMLNTVSEGQLSLDFIIDGETTAITRTVLTTIRENAATSGDPGCTASSCDPKRRWLEQAVDWAAQAQTDNAVISGIKNGMYQNDANWLYLDGHLDADWMGLIEGTLPDGNCVVFSDVLLNMSAVLGVNAGTRRRVSPGSFVTRPKLSLDPNFAMAGPYPSGDLDRYVFGMHSLVEQPGDVYHDATFNEVYSSRFGMVDWWFTLPYAFTTYDGLENWFTTIEGPILRQGGPLPDPYGDTWGNEWRYVEEPMPETAPIIEDVTIRASRNSDFVGAIIFEEIDANSDGVFDFLVANAQVEIDSAGVFSVSPLLARNGMLVTSQSELNLMSPSGAHIDAPTPGIYDVTVQFSGEGIFESGLDGPYDLQLSLFEGSTLLDTITAGTAAYSHTQFGELPALIVSSSDQGFDFDFDGRLDYIQANVGINVRTDGNYVLFASMSAGSTTIGTVGTIAESQDFVAGAGSYTLILDTAEIRRAGEPGPYTLEYTLVNTETGVSISESFETSPYLLEDMALTLVTPTGPLLDEGVDTNDNNLFDFLHVEFEAQLADSGTFLVSGALTNQQGATYAYTQISQFYWPGPNNIILSFDGPTIHNLALDGPYQLEVVVRDATTHDELDRVILADPTGIYSHVEFDDDILGDPSFSGVISEVGIDTNGNSAFELLDIAFQVDGFPFGLYEWSARLVDLNGEEIEIASESGFLTLGQFYLPLIFDGYAIGQNGLYGPFLIRDLTVFSNDTGASLIVAEVGETLAYNANQFEGYDTDGDGVPDFEDNCQQAANADQRDTDGDNIGNACDADVAAPNDCSINFLDLNVYKANFLQVGDLDTDNDGDGITNFLDLMLAKDQMFGPPGPSASGCN